MGVPHVAAIAKIVILEGPMRRCDGKEEEVDGFAGHPPWKGHQEDAIKLKCGGFFLWVGEGIRRRKDRAFSRRIVRGCTSQFNPFKALRLRRTS